MENFNPNGTGVDNGNYFGLPFKPEEAQLVIVSVPWDVTVSYGAGTCYAPDAIIAASTQLDLYDPLCPQQWRKGIATAAIDYSIQELSIKLREDAVKVIKHIEKGGSQEDDYALRKIEKINDGSRKVNDKVHLEAKKWLTQGKVVGLVGGDHSAPFGLIKAIAEQEDKISILHIDAHADLRVAYEGFEYSHASIMYNVATKIENIEKIVQVGIRDYCDSEAAFAEENPKIRMFDDSQLCANRFKGVTWDKQCEEIVSQLGDKVYVSFDIDGLEPQYAPNTGTPVPGGMQFSEAIYLVHKIAETGRTIVGFDVVEVNPSVSNEWDANVGARILYKLANITLKTKH